MPSTNGDIESRLWAAADQLWANSSLRPSEFSNPVLGLIFLRYADHRFTEAEKEIGSIGSTKPGSRRSIGKEDYQARGVLYLPEPARFSNLKKLPEGADLAQATIDAMKAIEAENEELKDILPKTYKRLENATLIQLFRILGGLPMDIEGDAFGKIYEYFLGKFAIEEYNSGSALPDDFFEKLIQFARGLNQEEKRAVSENLNEEELAVFDLLTKPDIKLSKKEEKQVKSIASELLTKLKAELLVLDWRNKQQTLAAVKLAIEKQLDSLPEVYTPALYTQKCGVVYEHVYESYIGPGESIYSKMYQN